MILFTPFVCYRFTVMCRGVDSFLFILVEISWVAYACGLMSSNSFRKFSSIVFSDIDFPPSSTSSPSGTPIKHRLKLFTALTISSCCLWSPPLSEWFLLMHLLQVRSLSSSVGLIWEQYSERSRTHCVFSPGVLHML